MRFERTPFPDAIETLGRVSGTKIQIDWEAIGLRNRWTVDLLRHFSIDATFPHTSLDHALLAVIASPRANLTCRRDGDRLIVTTEASVPRLLRVYDVGDLVDRMLVDSPFISYTIDAGFFDVPDPKYNRVRPATRGDEAEDLAQLLEAQVTPDAWSEIGGDGATIRVRGDRLLVFHTRRGHEQVERWLNGIRQSVARSKPPSGGGKGIH